MINSFWKDKKVFITGHTGFKGAWLALLLLEKGAIVCGYALKPESNDSLSSCLFSDKNFSNKYKDSFSNNQGDINDFKKMSKLINKFNPDIVFHLAAQSLVRESYKKVINTWNVNLIGTINLLESLKEIESKTAVVMITTDKVYKNQNWIYGYREHDQLGGQDPYSASKACMEIAIESWRSSFCGSSTNQNYFLEIASARAGNVIGGGDWAKDRLIPDSIKALIKKKPIVIRNQNATRPWQHVLEPLHGYILLAEKLYNHKKIKNEKCKFTKAYNFGPNSSSNKSVKEVIHSLLKYWAGEWKSVDNSSEPYESLNLNLVSELAKKELNWQPYWDFEKTISITINWYKKFHDGNSAYKLCLDDILEYQK